MSGGSQRASETGDLVSAFAFAPCETWQFESVERDRARLLSATPFEHIVARIDREATLGWFRCNKGKPAGKFVGKWRWRVKLIASAEAIDLWHNGRGGYRAQYYSDPAVGDTANAYARAVLAPTAERLIRDDAGGARFFPHGAVSIADQATRLWVYQGLWLRHARKADGRVRVRRWQDNARDADCEKFARLAPLTPRDETGLLLVGQWLDNGKPIAEPPKRDRAIQLHCFGFT